MKYGPSSGSKSGVEGGGANGRGGGGLIACNGWTVLVLL